MEKFCDCFTSRPSDLNSTLTYIIIDNFCPIFKKSLQFGAPYSRGLKTEWVE